MSYRSIQGALSMATVAVALVAAPVVSSAGMVTIDVNNPALWGEAKGTTSAATYGFDYSTYGIPLAPGAATPTAMRLRANVGTPGGNGSVQGITVSPVGVALTGDYTISAKVWINTFGPFNGLQSTGGNPTNFFGIGGGYTSGVNFRGGTTTAITGGGSGTWFAVANEGGAFTATSTLLRDYNAFTGNGGVGGNWIVSSAVYESSHTTSSAAQDHTHIYYRDAFPAVDVSTINDGKLADTQNAVASAQAGTAVTPQSGAGAAGVPLFAWREFAVERVGTTMTFSIDGHTIATLLNTTTGGALTLDGAPSLTYFDPLIGIAGYPDLDFALVSDFTITTPDPTPEPGCLGLVGLGLTCLVRRRNRR